MISPAFSFCGWSADDLKDEESHKVVTPQGKTMNSYLRNHDLMGMLPSPHEAEKRGLAPQDIFPHTCSVKIPVLNVGVLLFKQT